MKNSISSLLQQTGQFIVDGSMSTALEQMGANLNCSLWTASVLVNEPELVKKVHYNYFKAGADCGITCSYQATMKGLMENGATEEEAKEIIRRSVRLFCEARDEWWKEEGEKSGRAYPVCFGAVGPYGAYLADGSEYRGNYGISDEELKSFHKERMELLVEAGTDILLFETQPSLKEVLLVTEMAEEMGVDYIVSFSCRDKYCINEGDRIRDCAKILSVGHPHLQMVGVNCTKPEYIESLITEIRKGCDLPVIVYPNSGEIYDPKTKTWHGNPDALSFEEYALRYFEAGASAVGGCCTTTCTHVEQVVKAKEKYRALGCPKRIIL